MITRQLPPIDVLRKRLLVHEGVLYWRPVATRRPYDVTWNKRNAGRRVGVPKGNGYEMFRLGGRALLVHRVVYALTNGVDPGGSTVDHVNGKRSDNKPTNLRLATNAENVQHRSGPGKNNTSGVVGVSWNKAAHKWCAAIRVNGKNIHLGVFTNIDDAAAARASAERKYFKLKGL